MKMRACLLRRLCSTPSALLACSVCCWLAGKQAAPSHLSSAVGSVASRFPCSLCMKQEAALQGQPGLQHSTLLSPRPTKGCLQTGRLAALQAVSAGSHLQLCSLVRKLPKFVFRLQGEPWPAAFVGHEVDPLTQQEEQRRLMLERFQQEVLSLTAWPERLHAVTSPWNPQACLSSSCMCA